jgi:hypothetical protein
LGAGIGPGSEQQTFELDWFRHVARVGFAVQRHRGNLDGFYRAGFLDPYRNDGSLILAPSATFFAEAMRLDARYAFQYELNRYTILRNDHRNHRFVVEAEIGVP